MSVIQKIRDRGAWIMFGLIALALIAFILQDRAMGGGHGGFFSGNTTTIGKVNGQKIERADFEEKVTYAEKVYGQQVSSREQLIAGVWGQEVSRIIMQEEFDKLGITVGSKELSEILFDPNTSPLKREFTDQQTGEFRVNDARQAFAQLKKSKNKDQLAMVEQAYIDPTIQQALATKYNSLLQQSIYIPKWLVEKTQADNSAVSSISYVSVGYNTIADSTVKVSNDEIMAYAKKHEKEFTKEDETRSISYVSFNAFPSAADSAAILNQVVSFKNEFEKTDASGMAAFLAKAGSEAQFYDSYFSKTRLQQAQKDSITKLSVGQTYGPYIDGGSYTIAKMVGVKQWPDSVKVRHILIGTVNPQTGQVIHEDSVAKKLADSIQVAVRGGANFDSLVVKYTNDDGSKAKGGVYDYFPQGQMVGEFNEFAFDKPVGTKGVIKTQFGYHYIEVLGQKNVQPAYKIAYLSKAIVASNETVTTANNAASQFAASAKDKKAFDENASKLGKQILIADNVKENDFNVTGLGQGSQARQVVKWMYDHKAGQVSEPFDLNDHYVVAIVTSVNKPGLPSVETLRPQIELFVRNEKKAKQIVDTKFKGTTLDAIAASAGTQVAKADSILFANPVIAGIGNESKVIGAAFNKTLLTKVSDPIVGATGVFGVKVENIGAAMNANSSPEAVKQALLQAQRMALYRGNDALRKAADIKDYRIKFY